MYILYVYQQKQPTRLQIKRENKLEKLMQRTISDRKRLKNDGHLYFLVESVDVV